MDLESFHSFHALTRRRRRREAGAAPAGLVALRDRYVGRQLLDARGAPLGSVQDVLVSQREKIPRYLVVRRARWGWWPRVEPFVYPLRDLVAHDDDALPLRASHTAATIRRLLDFRPEFLRTTEDPDCISLVEYLSAMGSLAEERPRG